MSAKHRTMGKTPNPFAVYPTDPRLVRALLRAHVEQDQGPPLPGLNAPLDACDPMPVWCDPCANDGAIVRAVESYRSGGRVWLTADIRPEAKVDIVGDFRDPDVACGADVYLTNPPYTDEEEPDQDKADLMLAFARECCAKRAPNGHVLLLVRFGFFTALRRQPFIRSAPWDCYPLTPRPSFGVNKRGKKGTDGTDYVWIANGPGRIGRIWHPLDWRNA